jgi:FKBP-type peptidyl-prolyl cis-trans isomerase SlyD
MKLQTDRSARAPLLLLLIVLAGIGCLSRATSAAATETPPDSGAATVQPGMEIAIEYTLTLENNVPVESNVGSEPLIYHHGAHEILPGLEKALDGMRVGQSKHVKVTPDEGYGYVDSEAFVEVEKALLPQEGLKVGAVLEGDTKDGDRIRARVSEIKEETVVLDFNHPLAGKDLYLDVTVLSVGQEQE